MQALSEHNLWYLTRLMARWTPSLPGPSISSSRKLAAAQERALNGDRQGEAHSPAL